MAAAWGRWPTALRLGELTVSSLEHGEGLGSAPLIASELEVAGVEAGPGDRLSVERAAVTSVVHRPAGASWIAAGLEIDAVARGAGDVVAAGTVALASLRYRGPGSRSWLATGVTARDVRRPAGRFGAGSLRAAEVVSTGGTKPAWRVVGLELTGLGEGEGSGGYGFAAQAAAAGALELRGAGAAADMVAAGARAAGLARTVTGDWRADRLFLDEVAVRRGDAPRLEVASAEVQDLRYRPLDGFTVEEVGLRGLSAAVHRDAGGGWRQTVLPRSGPAPAPVGIERLTVAGESAIEVRDAAVEPPFRLLLSPLEAELTGFSRTDVSASARLTARAAAGNASVEVNALLSPAAYGFHVSGNGLVHELPLALLAPYGRKYLGLDLRSGVVDAALAARLDTLGLEGSGQVVLRGLDAAPVAGSPAPGAPPGPPLARQLGEVLNARIDRRVLDVELSGDLDDPRLEVRLRPGDGRLSRRPVPVGPAGWPRRASVAQRPRDDAPGR